MIQEELWLVAGWFISEATRLELHLGRQRLRPHVGCLPATQRIAVGTEPQPFHWQAKLFFAGAWWQANEQTNWPFSLLNDQHSVKLVTCIPPFWISNEFYIKKWQEKGWLISKSLELSEQSSFAWSLEWIFVRIRNGLVHLLWGTSRGCATSHLICSRGFPGVFAGWWNVTILTHTAVFHGKERLMELGGI